MDIYQKEYIEKLKYDNLMAWRNGSYVHDAVASIVSNVFGEKKEYPREPHRIFELTEEEKQQKAIEEREKAIAFFTAMEKSFEEKESLALTE